MRWGSVLCTALLLLAGSAEAQNKDQPPLTVQDAIRRLMQNGGAGMMVGSPKSATEAASTMRAFSRCVMSSPGGAGRMLSTLPGSEEESVLAHHIGANRNGCLNNGSLRFGSLLLRGTIAEGMLHRDFGGFGGKARRKPVTVYDLPSVPDRVQLPAQVQAALELQDLAGCVVGRAPDKVARLIATQAATDEEAAEWKRLVDDLDTCIDPRKSLKMSKLQLRGTLAEAAYRASVLKGRGNA